MLCRLHSRHNTWDPFSLSWSQEQNRQRLILHVAHDDTPSTSRKACSCPSQPLHAITGGSSITWVSSDPNASFYFSIDVGTSDMYPTSEFVFSYISELIRHKRALGGFSKAFFWVASFMNNSPCTADILFQLQVPSSLWSELAPTPETPPGKASQPRASAINAHILASVMLSNRGNFGWWAGNTATNPLCFRVSSIFLCNMSLSSDHRATRDSRVPWIYFVIANHNITKLIRSPWWSNIHCKVRVTREKCLIPISNCNISNTWIGLNCAMLMDISPFPWDSYFNTNSSSCNTKLEGNNSQLSAFPTFQIAFVNLWISSKLSPR